MNLLAARLPFGGTEAEQAQSLQGPASVQFTPTSTEHWLTQWSSIPSYSMDKQAPIAAGRRAISKAAAIAQVISFI